MKEAGTLVQVATCEDEGGLVLVDRSCHMRESTQTAWRGKMWIEVGNQ